MARWTDEHGLLTPEGVHAMFDALEEAERRKVERLEKLVQRCPDCGERGQFAGHMTCPYPQNHEEAV